MKRVKNNPLFHWGVVLRYAVLGAVPFLVGLWLSERLLGVAGVGAAVVVLAALLPFYALGWLGYQHWKHGRKRPPEEKNREESSHA